MSRNVPDREDIVHLQFDPASNKMSVGTPAHDGQCATT